MGLPPTADKSGGTGMATDRGDAGGLMGVGWQQIGGLGLLGRLGLPPAPAE